ncbi:Helix-turn-helix, AraC domain protein [Serratia sp. AS12]|uniref:AraC family transcriptional regulator n=1 Tax=Serratia TaxID=613 RepID=UPI00020E96E6|nr:MULTISPECIES: AraC family transcriptional regulator [Serratia]AEF44550.1 Helix-turn-helix, AraC domain protein [Serratia plymuthica AS9]AEF49502.1 Helix-turn-helix, AraC domain protein [Serratia sp. AS12]AEG27209.1 Helix-turn-helix, AraC domain protein [Serratia sp. AS13]UTN98058.1 AraC family transcriptional regulator [Serratia plymuthica]
MSSDQIPVSGALAVRFAALGVDIEQVSQLAGLPSGLLSDGREKARLSTHQYFEIWRALARLTNDAAFGLRLGGDVAPEHYDIASVAALHSATLGEALQKVARYKRLVCPEELMLTEDGHGVRLHTRWLMAEGHAPDLLIDTMFAYITTLCRRGTGMAIQPRAIELTRRQDPASPLLRYFSCPIHFNAPLDVLVFDRTLMKQPFITYNQDSLAVLLPGLEAELARAQQDDNLPAQVMAILARSMRGQRPSVNSVAAELYVSPRTLQRRLQQQGYSYQQLLDKTRHRTACHLLSDTDLEPGEIAFVLGFEELNSFSRAFMQWESQTPNRWRSRRVTARQENR